MDTLKETTLGENFLKEKSKSKVTIPIYQRGYDWDAGNINALWQDILDHIPGGKYSETGSGVHFFGFIWALEKKDEFHPTLSRWEIIDGQQRITSCVLILVAIRDYCQSRLESQTFFNNLSYTYLNYPCSVCKMKTHYFKDVIGKDLLFLKSGEPGYLQQGISDGERHAWVTCANCSATMDLEHTLDDDGNKLNSITEFDNKGNKLKRPRALYLKSKSQKEFKQVLTDDDGNKKQVVVEFPNEHTVKSEAKCYDDATINTIKRIDEILYVYDSTRQKPSGEPVIKLGLINNHFFENTILKKMTPDSKISIMKKQKNELTDTTNKISDVYKELIDLLKKFFDTKTTKDDSTIDEPGCKNFYYTLDSIIECILTQLTYHQIPVEDEFDAYRKFDTINNRGVGLANQDLIKTRIFTKLYQKYQNDRSSDTLTEQEVREKLTSYEKKWTDIRERINPKNKADYSLEKFLHHLIVIKYHFGTARVGDIFDKISEVLEDKQPNILIDEIDEWSKIFQKIRNPESFDWDSKNLPEIEWYLKTIRTYQSEICYHIILASYEKHWNVEKPNKKLFSKIIELSHRNFVRNFTIGRVSQLAIESLYKKIAVEIIVNPDFNVAKMQSMLLNDSKSSYVSDSEIKSKLNNKRNWYTYKLTKYFLEEISNSMGSGYSPEPTLQTEHIMPTNFNDDWKNHLMNEKIISEEDAKKLYEIYVNELGNLTLISKELNTSIKDALFKVKLGSVSSASQCYLKEQSYGITSKLDYYQKYKKDGQVGGNVNSEKCDITCWTDVEITDRAKKLMNKILDILDISKIKIPQNFTYEDQNATGDNTRAGWYNCLDNL